MKKTLYILFFIISLKGTVCAQTSSWQGLVLVGNKTGLESVSKKQIQGIFRGTQTIWDTNEQVIVVMPSNKADFADDFASSILQMTQSSLHKYWLGLVFQGRANAPVFLNSSAEIIDYVKKNQGAIGMVKMSEKAVPNGMLITISNRYYEEISFQFVH
jgi:ABC-type phosphate transport system substrate-binding protein